MRVAAFLTTLFIALVSAAPEMTAEKARERELCVGARCHRSLTFADLEQSQLSYSLLTMIYCSFARNAAAKVHPAAPMALAGQVLEAKTARDAAPRELPFD
jgi:hypothetical protein